MADGTLEGRVSGLERESARDGQRILELETKVNSLNALSTSVITLTVEFSNMSKRLDDFMTRVDKRDRQRDEAEEEREEERNRERLYSRRWLVGLAVTLICALVGAAAVILSAHT